MTKIRTNHPPEISKILEDIQEQAEAEGLRRSQRLRVQRNQSDQHSV